MKSAIDYAWLIPIFPFCGFLINVFFGTKLKKPLPALVAIGAMALSFVISLGCFAVTLDEHFTPEQGHRAIEWMRIGSTGPVDGMPIMMGYQIDPLSAMMLLVVTFIGGLIFIYSIGYMQEDPRFPRFFAYLSLFASAMLILVLADNFILLFTGWEGVGLCSYLLIGFWFERPTVKEAAKKAFLITRIGDAGMALGIYLLFALSGHFDFHGIFTENYSDKVLTSGLLVFACVLVFIGPMGKSAQFPLHIWLPDAMAGPTPVSALIHAATMVAAGVYLVARLFPLFALQGHAGVSDALTVVGYTGAVTAVIAATIGVAANDIKKVLAYSTVSQLGFMMAALGCGVGGYIAGVFHLMTHAFFKALLFLGSGSVIHAVEHAMHDAHVHKDPQDMWNMGGLRKYMPTTYKTYIIGALALGGFPGLAGFWSKDEIIHHALEHQPFIAVMLAFAAFLTAFYMTRQCYLVFGGELRDESLHVHDSPKVMTIPLVILAFFSLVIGAYAALGHTFLGWMGKTLELGAGGEAFKHELHKLHEGPLLEAKPLAISMIVALLGFLAGAALYRKPLASEAEDPIRKLGGLHKAMVNLWHLDFYEPIYPLGQSLRGLFFAVTGAFFRFDAKVVDGTVNLVGYATLVITRIGQLVDIYLVDGTVNLVGWVTKAWGGVTRRAQTGLAQNYMLVIVVGVIALIAVSRMLWAGPAH